MVDVRGKRVYLSGPMSGMADLNRPAFVVVHAELSRLGAGEVFDPAIEFIDVPECDHEWYMRRCLHALTAGMDDPDEGFDVFEDHIDLLVSLPGWQDSEGARLERAVAEACGIECAELAEVVG